MPEEEIKKALKRLENAELKVVIRGGEVVKIPCQEVELQEKDGVIIKYKIPTDII